MTSGTAQCLSISLSHSPGGSTRRKVGPGDGHEGVYLDPYLGGGGKVVVGSAMAPFERAMVVSYRLSIVTIALYLTLRPQFATEYLRRSNQQRGWSLWDKIWGGRVGRRKPNFNAMWKRDGLSSAK